MSEENIPNEGFDIPFSKKKEEIPPEPPRKKRKGFHIPAPAWFAIGCACVIGAILAGMYIRDSVYGKEIALLDSSRPVFAGYSGGGYLSEDFDPEASAIQKLEAEINEQRAKGRNTDSLEKLIASISCGFEKENGYANNENVIYACSYDQEAADQAGIRLTSYMKTYTVSGLAEYAHLDVFAGVSADWQIGERGLSIEIHAPQEYLDMGISYSTDYRPDSYNGQTVAIHAEFDQNVLRSYGYVVDSDEIDYPLGAMPEVITDLNSLSEEEKDLLKAEVQTLLENELAGCNWRATLSSLTGSYSIEITGISTAHIEESMASYFSDTPVYRITFDLNTNSESLISTYGSFTSSYSGSIYRMPDQSIRFLTRTVHACEFSGLLGSYSLKESRD